MNTIPQELFSSLSENSKLWVFPLSRMLSSEEVIAVQTGMESFVQSWKAHGAPVYGAATIIRRQFLFIAADEERSGVSGCSIDGMFRTVEKLVAPYQISVLSPAYVQYLSGDAVKVLPREEFQLLVNSGAVTETTTVFDNTVTTLAELHQQGWEKPFAKSWHAQAFS